MSKLIIHSTDEARSEVKVYYNGKMMECEAETALNTLDIILGLEMLNVRDVLVVKEDEIYEKLADLLETEDAYYEKALDDMDPDYAYEEFEIEGEEEAE